MNRLYIVIFVMILGALFFLWMTGHLKWTRVKRFVIRFIDSRTYTTLTFMAQSVDYGKWVAVSQSPFFESKIKTLGPLEDVYPGFSIWFYDIWRVVQDMRNKKLITGSDEDEFEILISQRHDPKTNVVIRVIKIRRSLDPRPINTIASSRSGS